MALDGGVEDGVVRGPPVVARGLHTHLHVEVDVHDGSQGGELQLHRQGVSWKASTLKWARSWSKDASGHVGFEGRSQRTAAQARAPPTKHIKTKGMYRTTGALRSR